MPDPSDFFSQKEISDNNYIIEEKKDPIFVTDSEGTCWSIEDVIVIANQRVCVYWQKNNNPVKYKEIFLSLDLLGKYMVYGGFIMDCEPLPLKTHTGMDGITRKWVIEANTKLYCHCDGSSYNGKSWFAISQDHFTKLINTVHLDKPTTPNVIFYEMGKCIYNLRLDKVLEWQMEKIWILDVSIR
jgi:hypothetical protein